MKKYFLFTMLSISMCVFAEEKRKPVNDPKDQERISRLMLVVQLTQIRLHDPKIAAEKALVDLEVALNELRISHHAEGCNLTIEKVWDCPPVQPTPSELPKQIK